MSTLNKIVLTGEPRGRQIEGVISGTPYPGTCMTVKAAVEPAAGRLTWEAFNRTADGKRAIFAILCENFRGGDCRSVYVAGERGRLYFPVNGDEFLMLCANIGGTADAFAIGDYLMIDEDTGKLIANSSGDSHPFQVMETVAALTADTLVHVQYGPV